MKQMTFKILFVVKASRVTRDGKTPVFLRVTINGQRCETSIALKVNPEKWNTVAERLIGDSREDQEVNFGWTPSGCGLCRFIGRWNLTRLKLLQRKSSTSI